MCLPKRQPIAQDGVWPVEFSPTQQWWNDGWLVPAAPPPAHRASHCIGVAATSGVAGGTAATLRGVST